MIIKKCTITTEEYIISIYSVGTCDQKVDVKLLDGTPIINDLFITNGSFIYLDSTNTISYGVCYQIKCIVLDALKYFEYWEETTEAEKNSLMESYPYIFA